MISCDDVKLLARKLPSLVSVSGLHGTGCRPQLGSSSDAVRTLAGAGAPCMLEIWPTRYSPPTYLTPANPAHQHNDLEAYEAAYLTKEKAPSRKRKKSSAAGGGGGGNDADRLGRQAGELRAG